MSERVSKEEKARLREDFRQLAAEVRLTEEEGAAANPALIGQLIRKNDELYSSVSKHLFSHPSNLKIKQFCGAGAANKKLNNLPQPEPKLRITVTERLEEIL
jgi:hypothetical protein